MGQGRPGRFVVQLRPSVLVSHGLLRRAWRTCHGLADSVFGGPSGCVRSCAKVLVGTRVSFAVHIGSLRCLRATHADLCTKLLVRFAQHPLNIPSFFCSPPHRRICNASREHIHPLPTPYTLYTIHGFFIPFPHALAYVPCPHHTLSLLAYADGDNSLNNSTAATAGGDEAGAAAAAGRRFWRTEYCPNEFASVRRASERVTLNLRCVLRVSSQ